MLVSEIRMFRIVHLLLVIASLAISAAAGAASAPSAEGAMTQDDSPPDFVAYTLDELRQEADRERGPWFEFLTRAGLEAGIYTLSAGETDRQSPHDRDEVYLVLSGRAAFTADGRTVEVGEGSVLFVAALVEHRFHDVAEDLRVLVFFGGPAEG